MRLDAAVAPYGGRGVSRPRQSIENVALALPLLSDRAFHSSTTGFSRFDLRIIWLVRLQSFRQVIRVAVSCPVFFALKRARGLLIPRPALPLDWQARVSGIRISYQ